MDEAKELYSIALHEQCKTGHYVITRVPGGWIYYTGSAVFVPYNEEFRPSN